VTTISTAFFLSLACSAAFTPLVIKLAHRLRAVDHALSSRKIHGRPVPRLGGIAIAAAFFVPITGLLLVNSGVGHLFYADGLRPFGLFIGGALIALLGVYDDLKGAGARLKFTVQFAVAALVYVLGYRIDALANPFGPTLHLGWLGLPFTMLWIAGVINAINLIDGLDGLAGGVSLVAVAITCVFAFLRGDPLMMLFTAALAGALIGFLRYNVNPAKIFMGDTGSMFLGFVLAVSAIETSAKSSTTVAILVPIIVLGLPITDTLLAMWRRGVRGAPLFQADRGHIHHRLLDAGLSHRAACRALWGTSVALGLVALALASASGGRAALILAGLAIAAGVVLRKLGYFQIERTAEVLEARRRNLGRRAALQGIAEQLRRAADADEVYESLQATTPALGADCVCMRFEQATPSERPQRHAYGRLCPVPGAERFCARYPLRGEHPETNRLKLGWSGGPAVVDRDTELAVDILCQHVRDALSRIEHDDGTAPAANDELVVRAPRAPEEPARAGLARVLNLRR